jgi:hypothetical protein
LFKSQEKKDNKKNMTCFPHKYIQGDKECYPSHQRMTTYKDVGRSNGSQTTTRAYSDNVSYGSSKDDDDDDDVSADWKETVINLKEENNELRMLVSRLERQVAALHAEAENVRLDVITRSQKIIECDQELYKRIGEFARQKLFRHIKFITSNDILNNLESKTSLANIMMDYFNINVRDRISWWRACSDAVSDAIGNQRNQVTQAIKSQVLSKLLIRTCVIFMDQNSQI